MTPGQLQKMSKKVWNIFGFNSVFGYSFFDNLEKITKCNSPGSNSLGVSTVVKCGEKNKTVFSLLKIIQYILNIFFWVWKIF